MSVAYTAAEANVLNHATSSSQAHVKNEGATSRSLLPDVTRSSEQVAGFGRRVDVQLPAQFG